MFLSNEQKFTLRRWYHRQAKVSLLNFKNNWKLYKNCDGIYPYIVISFCINILFLGAFILNPSLKVGLYWFLINFLYLYLIENFLHNLTYFYSIGRKMNSFHEDLVKDDSKSFKKGFKKSLIDYINLNNENNNKFPIDYETIHNNSRHETKINSDDDKLIIRVKTKDITDDKFKKFYNIMIDNISNYSKSNNKFKTINTVFKTTENFESPKLLNINKFKIFLLFLVQSIFISIIIDYTITTIGDMVNLYFVNNTYTFLLFGLSFLLLCILIFAKLIIIFNSEEKTNVYSANAKTTLDEQGVIKNV